MLSIRIHILHCGQVNVDKALPFSNASRNPLAFTGLFRNRKKRIWLPVSAYLIEHPKGNILIDTGWHIDVREHQKKHLGMLLSKINPARLEAGQAINEQLSTLGLQPTDVDYLLLSHLDCDHVSGLQLLKGAKTILTSREEWRAANRWSLRYKQSMWKNCNVKTYGFQSTRTGPQGLSLDLFGDGSITLIYAPGHSRGLTITKIENNGKYILLTSDCGYAEKSWQEMIMPGICVNRRQLRQSLQWVAQEAASSQCVGAYANHDANVKPITIEL